MSPPSTAYPCETSESDSNKASVSRRELLRAGLAAAALLVVAGCTSFRSSPNDLDKAYRNLQDTLDDIAEDDKQQAQLASIARRIGNRCRELTQEHDEFRERFDALSRKRKTDSAELSALTEGFARRRTKQRDELLSLQDELRRELTQDEWILAAEALTVKQAAYARPSVGGD
jgi:septal ring factor EnvC (AmiA/AmiB activator)